MAAFFRQDSDENALAINQDYSHLAPDGSLHPGHRAQDGAGVHRSNSHANSEAVSPLSSVTGSQADHYNPYTDYTSYSHVESRAAHQNYSYSQVEPESYQDKYNNEATLTRGGVEFHPIGLDDGGAAAFSPPRDPDLHQKHRYHVFRRWGWEIFSMVLAVLLLVAMVIILHVYEGQRVPDWGESFNLNTILALLSTFFRGLICVVIAEIISQAKWEWFSAGRTRPLRDLQDFDAASRGVWGALRLVPTALKGLDIVTVAAALLLVVSFGVGPTVQQTIRSSTCDYAVAGLNASLAYAHYVPRAGGFVRGYPGLRGTPDSDTSVAISSSLNSPAGVENLVTVSCPSGNCTFAAGDPIDGKISTSSDAADARFGVPETSYSTIGLCHMCMDVSSLVSVIENGDDYADFGLPNGLNITHGSFGVEMNVTASTSYPLNWTGSLMTSEFARASRWSLANITILTATKDGCDLSDVSNIKCPKIDGIEASGTVTNVQAASCILYPCVRTYVASVTNGLLVEDRIGSVPASLNLGADDDALERMDDILDSLQYGGSNMNLDYHYVGIKSPCRVNETVYTTEEELAAAPNATKMTLYETREDGSYTTKSASAPEACIYRHNAEFANAVGKELRTSLDGSCMLDPRTGPSCSRRTPQQQFYKPLEMLYSGGNASVALVDSYFQSVATAMTNRYRTTYGTSVFDDSDNVGLGPVYGGAAQTTLPLGVAEGVVWQTTVCTVVYWEWLAFSAALVVLTCILLLLTMARNWRDRRVRPVWKNSVLPLLFHGDRFGLGQGSLLATHGLHSKEAMATETYHNNTTGSGNQKQLLESSQMEEQASNTMTTFQWPEGNIQQQYGDGIVAHGTSSSSRGGLWRRHRDGRKKLQQWDQDSLEQQES